MRIVSLIIYSIFLIASIPLCTIFIVVHTEFSSGELTTKWWYPSDITQSGFPLITLFAIQFIRQARTKSFDGILLVETGVAVLLFVITCLSHLFVNYSLLFGTLHILVVIAIVFKWIRSINAKRT